MGDCWAKWALGNQVSTLRYIYCGGLLSPVRRQNLVTCIVHQLNMYVLYIQHIQHVIIKKFGEAKIGKILFRRLVKGVKDWANLG